MNPKQQSILERYGIPSPPEWSGMTGQGADTMYSIGGRWMKAGQKHPSGYTVGQYDPKSKSLGMSVHGVNIPVGMKAGSVKPMSSYEDPNAKLFKGTAALGQDPTVDMPTEMPKQYNGEDGNQSDVSFDLNEMLKSPEYAINKEMMERIRKNSLNNGYLSDRDQKNIITLEEFVKRRQGYGDVERLEDDTKYYIPRSDGEMDIFTNRNTYQ